MVNNKLLLTLNCLSLSRYRFKHLYEFLSSSFRDLQRKASKHRCLDFHFS